MPDNSQLPASFQEAIDRMERLRNEQGVPSNVKELLRDAEEELREDDEIRVRVQAATSLLDRVSNDLNIDQHTRTEIWNIASILENTDA